MIIKNKKIKNVKRGLLQKIKYHIIYRIEIKERCLIFLKLFLLFIIIYKTSNSFTNIDENIANILPSIDKNGNQIKTKNIKKIFRSRRLYINDNNITKEYINFIRPINGKKNKEFEDISIYEKKFYENNFKKRKDQLNFRKFAKLCVEEKLISDTHKLKANSKPLISVILPSYNTEKDLMKSVRSVQNQSLKNIEIIIVDDCSTDNSWKYYKLLLETDPRIRLFSHLKNMAVWRARIDGLLYSRGKYVIFFDTGDIYEDNYVLEDAYNIIEKYGLDSVKMFFRLFFDYNNLTYYEVPFNAKVNYTKIGNRSNMFKYNSKILFPYVGVIWNRLVRSDIYIKGLNLLSDSTLNIYKNLWEDRWWTRIADDVSNNLLIIKRYCYLYYKNISTDNLFFAKTEKQKDNLIHEFVYFLYFDLDFLAKEDNKKFIIKRLIDMNNNKYGKRSLNRFKTKFYIVDNLVKRLLDDPYVTKEDKVELNNILQDSIKRQNDIKREKENKKNIK